jgi:hypothetical protein
MNNLRYISFKKKKKIYIITLLKEKGLEFVTLMANKNQDIYQFAIAHLMNGIFFTAIIVISSSAFH